MNTSETINSVLNTLGAHNYNPLPVVLNKGKGVWVWDVEGNKYMDFLSSYSALNFGHCHPEIVCVLQQQSERLTLTSRAFNNEELAKFYSTLQSVTHKEMFLPMNTGAEAVETAIKAARRWGYQKKGIPVNKAEIIVCDNNFHGRAITIISFSSSLNSKTDFGPYTPGFVSIPFNDRPALKKAINPNTCAFLMEPIQGEGGVIVPEDGYLKAVHEICKENNVLWICDEIQTGLGRTGKIFACDYEEVVPDIYTLGKALGGGVLPISVVAGDKRVMEVFNPGSHGSTFGGNPLACAVATASLNLLIKENLAAKAFKTGLALMEQLKKLKHPDIDCIRGKGLLIGIVLKTKARPYCERLKDMGLLCKETHGNVIRLAPPLIITEEEIQYAMERLNTLFK